MNSNKLNLFSRLVTGAAVLTVMTATAYAAPASASYLFEDATTQGNWNSQYGQDGSIIADGTTTGPTYASASVSGGYTYLWAGQTSDLRALQTAPGSSTRVAAAFTNYQNNSFALNVNTTGGLFQMVSLYLLDWDSTTRSETITLTDASSGTVLNQRTFSNFHNGKYEVYYLSGNVTITVTPASGTTPVVSGIFFGSGGSPIAVNPSSSAAVFQGTDNQTQGNWTGVYGANGYMIANSGSSKPTYATDSITGDFTYTWSKQTIDQRALQTYLGSSSRIASAYTDYQSRSFTININVNDGNTHRISLYMLDWDSMSRMQTVTITDLSTGTLLDTKTFANFFSGVYASWNVKGNIVITIAPSNSSTPVVSGLFFN